MIRVCYVHQNYKKQWQMWNFLELIVSPTSRLLPFANYRQSFHYVMGENGTRAWCNLRTNKLAPLLRFIALTPRTAQGIPRSERGGTRWRTGGEVKGKLENGVGSRYCHTISGRGVSSITNADAHTSAASSRLNGLPRWFKWTRPFRRKTKSGSARVPSGSARVSITYCPQTLLKVTRWLSGREIDCNGCL